MQAFACSAVAGTAFALTAFHVAPNPAQRRNLVKLAAGTMMLPVLWHAQDEMRGPGHKALNPPMVCVCAWVCVYPGHRALNPPMVCACVCVCVGCVRMRVCLCSRVYPYVFE